MLIKTNRRRFIGALGAGTFAASALRFFIDNAEAQAHPKRFIVIFTPNGHDHINYSSGTGPDYTLGEGLAMFSELKRKFTVLDGLQIPEHGGEEHPAGRAAMLTSWKSKGTASTAGSRGQSIDIFLANQLTNGNAVYLGDHAPNEDLDIPISWFGADNPNDNFLEGTAAVQQALFRNAPLPSEPAAPSDSPSPTLNETLLNEYLVAEVQRLRQVAPQEEFQKLDQHLQALAQVRDQLAGPQDGSTAPLRDCDSAIQLPGNEADNIGLLLAHALACGQTRIAVFRIGSYEPSHAHSHWLEDDGDVSEFRAIEQQWFRSVSSFLRAMDSFEEGGNTLLDNSAVVWTSEVSNHYKAEQHNGENNTHGTWDMPFWLAGSLGGSIRAGERIVAQDRYAGELYKAIGSAMGVSNADLAGYGEAAYAPGILQEVLV